MADDLTSARAIAAAHSIAQPSEYLKALLQVALATYDRDANKAPTTAPEAPMKREGKKA